MASQNIYAQYAQPVRSVADYAADYDAQDIRKLQLAGAQRQNALTALTQQEKIAGMSRNALVQAAQRKAAESAGGDEFAYAKNLRLSGLPELIDSADKVDKAATERKAKASENAGRDIDTQNKAVLQWNDLLGKATDQGQAGLLLQAMHTDPRLAGTPGASVPIDQHLQMLAKMPFNEWKQTMALGAAKFVEMNKPQYITQNLGGASRITAVPGLGAGPAVTASEAKNTQSPDSAASNARMAADAAAGRAQSASQFNQRLAYDKEKDKTAATGGANITEGERNAGGYAARMVEASKLLDQFEGKGRATYKTDALGGVPLVGRALQTSAMTAEQQQYRQAQEDWVRAKLRKESGASIAPDEMAREISAYFPEPGDRPENIAQKRQARAVANQAMVQSAGRGAPKAEAAKPAAPMPTPKPGAVLRFDAQGNPVQ